MQVKPEVVKKFHPKELKVEDPSIHVHMKNGST